MISSELLIPLLRLAGDSGLETGDNVKYLSFLRYLLDCGFMAFGGVPARRVLTDSIEALELRYRSSFSFVKEEMRNVTSSAEVRFGRAAQTRDFQQWPFMHHRFAHSKLTWLSVDGRKRDLL